jgi:hypothetical protein
MGYRTTNRLEYLDWLRGIGAVIMLQGHTFHSFMRPDLRAGEAYSFSQFVGGMPPAIFLFLTGVTLAFLMASGERKGLPAARRVGAAVRRAGYLFLLAVLFRLQLWAFAWLAEAWTDLLRVDILNAMGFAMLVLAPLAALGPRQRVRVAAVAGFAIAFAAPVVSQLPAGILPPLARAYVVPDLGAFSFFPWAAYLAFGISAGSLIRILPQDMMDRAMRWSALGGAMLAVTSQYFATLPFSLYPRSDFWLNSPAQILTKQGVTMLLLSCAYLWTRYGAGTGWSWVRQLGTTSLLVYWVHIELVYGRWLYFWKNALSVPQTVLAATAVILLMLALSTVWTRRYRIAEWFAGWRWAWNATPDRVPGD